MLIATLDTGTTNTRVVAWRDGAPVAEAGRPVGVRDTAITGSTDKLKAAVGEALAEAIAGADVAPGEDRLYLASGMITSNAGLREIPHLAAPAGKAELAAGMQAVELPGVCDRPIWLIPGVKSHGGGVGLDDCDAMDIMRGEETEAMGVLSALGIGGPAVLALPGSHAKFVGIDAAGRITGSMTTISGELLDAISRHTLIAGSVDHGFADEVEPEALLKGAAMGAKLGVARSAFLVRLLDLFGDLDRNGRASFLLGAVLAGDLAALKSGASLKGTAESRIIVAGKAGLRDALVALFTADRHFTGPVETVPDGIHSVSALGAMEVARARGLI
ncbi:putative 2-dehydro-3-deoxygalactonokinase protein [uncultured Pleomorphomonas sp.]|uniref:Putative 2-dehydro-3-deoxygalactonokinase protein n=1 Tax=uncultured Pleomorphomonas sp. TaxID=442121 RepID=A0A212L0X2_9HYPH|nr:2-dehydro-3-deoxygalactonokinase [uncultured Pleomorphomonas sp.]SCM71213.1 putative 2-dehydro-3-deoxygalactonokinase protein [uncultured Pleomorphomonas sp.]